MGRSNKKLDMNRPAFLCMSHRSVPWLVAACSLWFSQAACKHRPDSSASKIKSIDNVNIFADLADARLQALEQQDSTLSECKGTINPDGTINPVACTEKKK